MTQEQELEMKAQFEPGAVAWAEMQEEANPGSMNLPACAAVSQAISLKRIADALDGVRLSLGTLAGAANTWRTKNS